MAREERWDTWRLQREGGEKPREGQERMKRKPIGLIVPGTVSLKMLYHGGAEQRLCVGKCAEAASLICHLRSPVSVCMELSGAGSKLVIWLCVH